jgi:hypothetical protein
MIEANDTRPRREPWVMGADGRPIPPITLKLDGSDWGEQYLTAIRARDAR